MVEIQRSHGIDAAESWEALAPATNHLPLGEPLRIRRSSTVFVTEKA